MTQPASAPDLILAHDVRLCFGAVGESHTGAREERRNLLRHVDLEKGSKVDKIELSRDGRGSSRYERRIRTEVDEVKECLRGEPADRGPAAKELVISLTLEQRAVHEQSAIVLCHAARWIITEARNRWQDVPHLGILPLASCGYS